MFFTALSTSPAPLPTWKRLIDFIGAASALPLLATGTVLVSILLALTSPGPIFFRQSRVGYKGRPFLLYKFRTMHVGAETVSHQNHMAALQRSNRPMQKLDGKRDPRLVAGGWLIRASGLDELPQILNVFRGEMSLVGPRPSLPYEHEQLTPEQQLRCEAVPGITGLWQVSGKNSTTFNTMIQLDLAYVTRASLRLDLAIITLTIPVLLRQMIDIGVQRLRVGSAPGSSHPIIASVDPASHVPHHD